MALTGPLTGPLTGLRIAIAGAGGALGSRIAARFVAEGAAALTLGDLNEAEIAKAASRLRSSATPDQQIVSVELDVTDPASVRAFVQAADELAGGIDVYVGNAGILSPSARIHNVSFDDLHQVMDVNFGGAFNGLQAVLPVMRRAGRGSIIFTASVAGLTAWSHTAPYCVSKAALIQLTKVAAVEYARDGIRVNCVCPGTFRTAIHDGLPESALDAIAERHPIGRLGQAEEMVGAYVYLAGRDSTFTTGSTIVVDGGYSA